MKKIIKIAALILALICIGTSFASCGKNEKNDSFYSENQSAQTISNADLAANIRGALSIDYSYHYIDSQGAQQSKEIHKFAGPELLNPDGYSLMSNGTNPNKPENVSKDYLVTINAETREVIVSLFGCGRSTGYDGINRFKIYIPVKIISTSYGVISATGYSVIAEFLTENIKTVETITQPATWYSNEYTYEVEHYYITQTIIIKY